MKTHVYQQYPKMNTKSTRPASPFRVSMDQSNKVSSILHLQRTIGNQTIQRMLQTEDEKGEAGITSNIKSVMDNQNQESISHSTLFSRPTLNSTLGGEFTESTLPRSTIEIHRKGCQPGAVIVIYDKQGKGCTAKVKMNVAVQRCVTKCSDKTRLAEINSFGQKACRNFCLKENAASYYAKSNKCVSRTCDSTPGECPKRCPIFNYCNSSLHKQWNCMCSCGIS